MWLIDQWEFEPNPILNVVKAERRRCTDLKQSFITPSAEVSIMLLYED
jgi:hypothetical protein